MSARHPKGLDVTKFLQAYKKSSKDDDERGSYIWVFVLLFPLPQSALSLLSERSAQKSANIIQDNLHGEAGA
jgi:hypothetical protein